MPAVDTPQPDRPRALRCRNVSVASEGRTIIHGVDFDLGLGQAAMLIGPNGAGKTTLLNAILGIGLKHTGTIEILGFPNDDPMVRGRVAYVPQKMAIEQGFPLTVVEFLRVYAGARAALPGRRGREEKPDIPAALAELGLTGREKRLLGELSGGEIQRLLLAAAFLDNPALMILDEPLAGIDLHGEQTFYSLIEEYRHHHPDTSFVLVSHDISVVYRHADVVFCLNQDICFQGLPSEVLTDEAIHRLYGGHQHGIAGKDTPAHSHVSH